MAPSTLDIFIFTFNCAKNLINAAVFATHFQAALTQNATGLPDLVVFSLQEVAPLSYSFIGSYFLGPYYSRFEEALHLAAVQVLQTGVGGQDGSSHAAGLGDGAARPSSRPYTLVKTKNVGMTAILFFARTPEAVRAIEEAECGFGAADMGNKGAVGLRVTWSPPEQAAAEGDRPTTELTFVATHLAAMEWNLKKRNANWRRIVSGLTFEDPQAVVPEVPARSTPVAGGEESENEAPRDSDSSVDADSEEEPLLDGASPTAAGIPLSQDAPELTAEQRAALQRLSIFKPTSHLFVAGDLNYRIGKRPPPPLSPFPSFDTADPHHWSTFLDRDQLSQERAAGRTLHGLTEAEIRFGPSYKYDVLPTARGAANEAAAAAGREVPWRWAPHRWPSWCDRILYLDLPPWVKRRQTSSAEEPRPSVVVRAYDIMPLVATSDHRPVFLRVQVPVLGPDEMAPPPGLADALSGSASAATAKTEEDLKDPRVVLPVPIDVNARQRRATARRREIVVGWSMLVWSTPLGAALIGTTLVLAVGSWWLWRS